jgi:hypothetical protein
MKLSIRHWMLSGISAACLLNAALSQAETVNTTVFSEPGQFCFGQTRLRGVPDKTILDHYLIIPKEYHFKIGDVFIGFRRKSEPDALWLTDGSEWRAYDDSEHPYMAYKRPAKLDPVIKAKIFMQQMDVTEFEGDGEIWVGYGLRKDESATEEDSFQDMMDNQRYYRLWQIGIGFEEKFSTICLTTTKMTERKVTAQ